MSVRATVGTGKAIAVLTASMREVLDAAVQKFVQTMRIRMAEEQKGLKQKQKMWELRKPVLDAHILSLQKRIQELEQVIDGIVMEKLKDSICAP